MHQKHDLTIDYECPRCRMVVRAYIPHECDPSVCVGCDGHGRRWNGTKPGRRAGFGDCDDCGGTGKTVYRDGTEDEGMGVMV